MFEFDEEYKTSKMTLITVIFYALFTGKSFEKCELV